MDVEEIRKRIDHIDEIAYMAETAHKEADQLYRDVLQAIAQGASNPSELAQAALKAEHLGLDKYYSLPHD